MSGISGLELIARQIRGGCKAMVGNKAVLSGTWRQEELRKAQGLGCKVFDKPHRADEIEVWLDARKSSFPETEGLSTSVWLMGEERFKT